MAFRDFEFPGVQQALGLTLSESDLFADIPTLQLRPDFVAFIHDGTELALAIHTEKARSEFIIAPVLFELRRSLGIKFGLFSGVELDVDAARGLNGYCDFILTRSPSQLVLSAPLITIVEAKNDTIRNGLAQCIAAMVAAAEFNQKKNTPLAAVYGVVTTGSAWKFLRLQGSAVVVDTAEYYIVDLGKIMGILSHILRDG